MQDTKFIPQLIAQIDYHNIKAGTVLVQGSKRFASLDTAYKRGKELWHAYSNIKHFLNDPNTGQQIPLSDVIVAVIEDK